MHALYVCRAKPPPAREWKRGDLPPHNTPPNVLTASAEAVTATTPLEMFRTFVDDDMIDLLQLESNRFAIQLGRTRIKSIANPEIRAVIGILFYMSVVHLPTRRMYWSQLTRQDSVADVLNDDKQIRRNTICVACERQ